MVHRYYPCQYWVERSYARETVKALEVNKAAVNPAFAQKVAGAPLLKDLSAKGWSWQSSAGGVATFAQELQGLLTFSEWALKGRTLVSVSRELSEAFLHSDSGDMRISDVLPDQATLYVAFDLSKEHALRYSEGRVTFEGAYVLMAPDTAVRIVVCGRMAENTPVLDRWLERYDLRISAKYFDLPANEALQHALEDDLSDLANAEYTLQQGGDASVAADAARLAQRQKADHVAFSTVVKLVLNALAYKVYVAEDSCNAWSPDAPPRYVAQTTSFSKKDQARAQSKLWALGHVPVIRLGDKFSAQMHASGYSVRAHWRRGHWRNQPHGPQFSLRKLLWIRPMVVGANAE